ncbi:MAG: SUMF1/EgtB/PvdO family nonheme iron enzyme, partial [Chloroflexota bacterium]|nr:SUMF1/EgtB/PvdO family nonheme iron enzyme [Chloroflexota bacterium]
PYQGLAAFCEADAPFFCGRKTFIDQLVASVERQPLVAVLGSSGAGKSSVVFAGLVPQLRGRAAWLLAAEDGYNFRPGDQPFHALASTLLPLLESHLSERQRLVEQAALAADLQQGRVALRDVVTRILHKHAPAQRLLLVADQFEELYTVCRDTSKREAFLGVLLAAVPLPAPGQMPPLTLVLTMRADFYGQALAYRPLADALQPAVRNLGPMTRAELQTTIEEPARRQQVSLEDGLTSRLLEAVAAVPGELPLLEFTLTQLWERQYQGRLTHAAYTALGGVAGSLAQYAEDVYAQHTPEEQEAIRRIFVQLVQPGQGTEDTRRVARRTELDPTAWELVTQLASERLVVTGYATASGEETLELVHEALIAHWARLREWIANEREFRAWQERLRQALHDWEVSGHDTGGLLRGAPLATALDWQQKHPAMLSTAEQGFIATSRHAQEADVREREALYEARLTAEKRATGAARRLAGAAVLAAVLIVGWYSYNTYTLPWQAHGPDPIGIAGGTLVLTDSTTLPVIGFVIEPFEVTNARYALCVQAQHCLPPPPQLNPDYYKHDQVEGPSDRAEWPMVGVDGVQAATFCDWIGRRLPTFAEWAYAATQQGKHLWPWGDDPQLCMYANLSCQSPFALKQVGQYAPSPQGSGIYDLIGNAMEWTRTEPTDEGVTGPAWEFEGKVIPDNLLVVGWSFVVAPSVVKPPQTAEGASYPISFRDTGTGFR